MQNQVLSSWTQPPIVADLSRNLIIGLMLLLTIGLSASNSRSQEGFKVDEQSKHYTQLPDDLDSDNFQFAVVGDHTGGHRSGVFKATVEFLNLLQPDFVMSVGDLIEGYVDDRSALESQWNEIDELLSPLTMPFFLVPGNHDVNFDPSEEVWFERVGAGRSYSHFLYKNVLFLLVSTEDPPKRNPDADLLEKYQRLKTGEIDSEEEAKRTITELEEWAGKVNISDAQVAYFASVLADNSDARWTFVFMHSPPWEMEQPGNFLKIESLLSDRPFTMFAGHTHTYHHTQRNGRDYITMGMTGAGVPGKDLGHMDHLAWISMTDEGPKVSNLLLNGILDIRGAVPAVQDFLIYRPRSSSKSQ